MTTIAALRPQLRRFLVQKRVSGRTFEQVAMDEADSRFEAVSTASMTSVTKDTYNLILADEEERRVEAPEQGMPVKIEKILAKIERAGGRAKFAWFEQLNTAVQATGRAGELRPALNDVRGAIMSQRSDSVQRAIDTFKDHWNGTQV